MILYVLFYRYKLKCFGYDHITASSERQTSSVRNEAAARYATLYTAILRPPCQLVLDLVQ